MFLHIASRCFPARTNKTPSVSFLNELSMQETFQVQQSYDNSHHKSTNRLLYSSVSDQLQPSELSHLYRSIQKSRNKNFGCYQQKICRKVSIPKLMQNLQIHSVPSRFRAFGYVLQLTGHCFNARNVQ